MDASSPSQPHSTPIDAASIATTFAATTNLTSSRLNARVIAQSDEFFAAAANLLTPTPPIHKPNTYVATGAWYDGWETRRHNYKTYDWVIIRLGAAAGCVHGIEIDTAFFDGNHAPEVSVEGVFAPGANDDAAVVAIAEVDALAPTGKGGVLEKGWVFLLEKVACGPSARHVWALDRAARGVSVTHLRLRMYPDGGIARFRALGTVDPVWTDEASAEVELSAALNGGVTIACSDQHFGAAGNLLLPGRGVDMGDGWETRRSRGQGHVDWAVVKLGAQGRLSRVVVDTMHFRGNFPRAVKVEACYVGQWRGWENRKWVEIVKERVMKADEEAECEIVEGASRTRFDHVRLTIIPDGGVKRLRIFGTRD